MTDSINQNNTQTSLASDLKTTLAFSAAFPTVGAMNSVIRNRGVKNAVSSLELEKFKNLNLTLKQNKTDIFTRGIKLSESYDIYKDAAKKAKKLSNKLNAATKRQKVSLFQSFKNLFTKNKVTLESLKEAQQAAQKNLDIAQEALQKGKILTKDAKGVITSTAAAEAAKLSTKGTVKNLFKSEIKNKFVLGITIMTAIPRIQEEIIPAFKEKGILEGLKATGKVIARTATDFVSNAGFSAVGRAIGTALGSFAPGVGNAIGGLLGDAIGSCISMRLTSKIFDKNKKEQNQTQKQTMNNNTPKIAKQNASLNTNADFSGESLTGNRSLDRRIQRALTI